MSTERAQELVNAGGDEAVRIVNINKTIKIKDNKTIDRRKKAYPLFHVDLVPKPNNKNVYGDNALGILRSHYRTRA